MFIIHVNTQQPLDKALKILKGKTIRTKQNEKLRDKQVYQKKSEKKRNDKLKAIYREQFKSQS